MVMLQLHQLTANSIQRADETYLWHGIQRQSSWPRGGLRSGCGAYPWAAEHPTGSSSRDGAGGGRVSGLLLGAVELEVEDGGGVDALDGYVSGLQPISQKRV